MLGVDNVGNGGGRSQRALLEATAGFWLLACPTGCTSPALCRQQIPSEEAGFCSAISPGLTEVSHKAYKKKKGRNKGKGSQNHDTHNI